MKLWHLVAACGLVSILASSCTDSAAGNPTAATSGASTAPTTTSTTTSRVLPPRPRDIDLAGIDPCTLLTVDQAREMDYDDGYEVKPQHDVNEVTGAPDCSYGSTSRGTGMLIAPVTTEDASVWLTSPDRETNTPPVKTDVGGFPALQISAGPNDQDTPPGCHLIIDVHDGQYIDVFINVLDGKPGANSTYCAEAKKVGGMAINTVESRR